MRETGFWIAAGAANGLIAVAAGAFAAHGLTADGSGAGGGGAGELVRTAARYEMWHALALLAVAAFAHAAPGNAKLRVAGGAFLAGIILFSGSLYFLAATGWRPLGWMTPIGGLAFLGGWLALIAYALTGALTRRSD